MNIDQLMADAERRIQLVITPFLVVADELTVPLLYQMRDAVLAIMEEYYHQGYIDVLPYVDINHIFEIAILDGKIESLNNDLQTYHEGTSEHSLIITVLKKIQIRRENLTETVKNRKEKLLINLKDRETLEPYVWPYDRGNYDH